MSEHTAETVAVRPHRRMSVRIAFFGNIANAQYRLVRALRSRAGIDAHLFIADSDVVSWRPENEDPDLAGAYPDWIHAGNWVTARSLVDPARSAIARELGRFDLIVASGVAPVFAQHAGRPWCFMATGGDLTVKPFPTTFWRFHPTWFRRAAQLVAGRHQKRAIRSADRLLYQPFAPFRDAAELLGLDTDRLLADYLPVPVDVDRFDPDAVLPDHALGVLDQIGADREFVVFHPSRLVIEDTPLMRRTGQWKGNDTLVHGFAELVRRGNVSRPALVLVDSPCSRDREPIRRLVRELGLDDLVFWVRPPNGDVLSQPEMAALYRRADVVVNEFGVGWFGFVTLEGCAMGRPVVSHLDQEVMARMYPWHPVIEAKTPKQVADRFEALAADPDERRRAGERSREWALEFHAPDRVAERYVDAFTSLAAELLPVD